MPPENIAPKENTAEKALDGDDFSCQIEQNKQKLVDIENQIYNLETNFLMESD
ncbi:MAG: hypothetical protein MHPSP_002606, partial [Paramarteilia canceri]